MSLIEISIEQIIGAFEPEKLQLVIYSVALFLVLLSAFIIYKIGQMKGEVKISRMIRSGINQTWEQQKAIIQERYKDEAVAKMFEKAGSPKWLSEVTFKFTRDCFIIFQLIYFHGKWLFLGGSYPIQAVSGIMLIGLVLSTRKGFPLEKLLVYFEKIRNSKKNRELYILYSLLLNEYTISGNKPTNIYTLLRKFRPHFKFLKPALDLCTMHWRRSTTYALETFAREVGTSQAKDLAGILADVDKLAPEDAYTLLTNRYDHFNTIRLEEFRRRSKDRGIIGYFVTFVPALSILFNFGYVYYLEYKDLIGLLNTSSL